MQKIYRERVSWRLALYVALVVTGVLIAQITYSAFVDTAPVPATQHSEEPVPDRIIARTQHLLAELQSGQLLDLHGNAIALPNDDLCLVVGSDDTARVRAHISWDRRTGDLHSLTLTPVPPAADIVDWRETDKRLTRFFPLLPRDSWRLLAPPQHRQDIWQVRKTSKTHHLTLNIDAATGAPLSVCFTSITGSAGY